MSYKEKYEEEQGKLRQLALLCLSGRELTDEELISISEHGDRLRQYIDRIAVFASSNAARTLHARRRQRELEKLPTEELERIYQRITGARAAAMADDVNDEASDSLYEAPSFDSDEHILYKILCERKQTV